MTRIQLHGRFAVQVDGRAVERDLPGRRGRLLVAYLAAHRLSAVDRATLIALLWHPADPGQGASAGFTVVLSKTRAALAPIEIRGRGSLQIVLPPHAMIDAAVAAAALHEAEAAVGRKQWRRAWTQSLSALFVTQRQFLSDLDHPWVEERRRAVRHDHERALACYAEACLELGGVELPSAERSARRLIDAQPLSETGYCLLMRALARRGDHAAALGVYDRLRSTLRDDLGVSPSPATQELFTRLL
ncbi:AfsR/SARP family transcriptional regulator [Pseudonocardia nigra]|uniref:AfsR/SARP family transcriptional regulator n=1 Tax=Pseudonocardia nigra TaxID=1921578 RepID=UPI001C5E3AFB|nr:bacterial transcriptional activator domain-containing protein [Pseudonocardia nigra]